MGIDPEGKLPNPLGLPMTVTPTAADSIPMAGRLKEIMWRSRPRDVHMVRALFRLVTLVSMIAPSPDWFVGVDSLDLLVDGEWVDEIIVELLAYDSGTDDGPRYTSPNAESNPHAPIARITTLPFDSDTPLGTFTLTRIPPEVSPEFTRGDTNGDAALDISDAIFILVGLFQGGGLPECQKSADSNDDGEVDISDSVYLLAHLFTGGAKPPEPFRVCGMDATNDGLSCESYPACE